MKKKLIALLCALSMLATSVVAIAEDADVSPEAEIEVTEQAPEEVQEALDEPEGEEEAPAAEEEILEEEEALDEEIPVEEEIPEEEILVEEENNEDEEAESEIVEDAADEEPADAFASMSAPVVLMSEPEPVDAVEADKAKLEAILAEANAVTGEMVSASVFSALASAISAAQAVYDDAAAAQEAVDAQVSALAAALEPAVQETRDNLYEALAAYKGLDGGILDVEKYNAYAAAYKAGQTAFWDAEKTAAELYELAANIAATYDVAKDALSAREKILSGNVRTDADRAFYPGMESDTLPKLKYTWTGVGTTGPNPEPSGQDMLGEERRLLSGVGATPYDNIPNICWGRWSWMGTTNLDFNMGEDAYVTGADFWENAGQAAGTNYCSDEIKVYTSNDGAEWTLQKSVVVDQSDTPNSLKGTRVDFDAPVKCRYVRVAVIDARGYQVKYNEVVLRGYRTTQVATAPFVIEDIDYKSVGSGAKRIISLDGESRVRITGNVKNTTDEEKEVVIISAAYKDGDIIDLTFGIKTIASYGSESFTNTVSLGGETDVKLHTFVWDNFENANALSEIETFGLGKHEMAEVIADGEGAAFDVGSERLTVWGTTGTREVLNDVTVLVLKAGTTNADMAALSNANKKRAIVYLEQTSPASNGRYSFESFPTNTADAYGNNNVYVKKQGEDQLFYRMLYLDNAGEDAIIEAFKGAADATEMRAVIDANEVIIRGVKAVDEIIAKYDTDTVLNSVAGMILDTEYETGEELLAEILAAVALTDLNNVATKAEAIQTIDTYCEEFGIADNGIYTKLYSGEAYEDFKNEISEKFVGQNYTSIKDFIAEFCEEIVVDMLNDATNYTDVAKVLFADTEYADSIGFDIEEYEDLTSAKQIRVQKQVMNHGNFTDMEDVIDAFNAATANPGTDKSYGSSGGSGGGGGFSSSPSLGTSIPLSGVTANDMSAFKDLGGAEWARESILALHKKGIVSGMTSDMFAPNDDVTREQFTKMIIAAFGLEDASADCDFDDVDKDAWYYEAIASAVASGIVYGISEDSFGIGAKITREDMAVLAYRVLVAKGNKVIYDKSQISDFTDDAEISEYAREAVYAMRGNSVMLGRGNNEFQPKAQATRAEAAKIIYSIMVK